jgi:hypothetical protein
MQQRPNRLPFHQALMRPWCSSFRSRPHFLSPIVSAVQLTAVGAIHSYKMTISSANRTSMGGSVRCKFGSAGPCDSSAGFMQTICQGGFTYHTIIGFPHLSLSSARHRIRPVGKRPRGSGGPDPAPTRTPPTGEQTSTLIITILSLVQSPTNYCSRFDHWIQFHYQNIRDVIPSHSPWNARVRIVNHLDFTSL